MVADRLKQQVEAKLCQHVEAESDHVCQAHQPRPVLIILNPRTSDGEAGYCILGPWENCVLFSICAFFGSEMHFYATKCKCTLRPWDALFWQNTLLCIHHAFSECIFRRRTRFSVIQCAFKKKHIYFAKCCITTLSHFYWEFDIWNLFGSLHCIDLGERFPMCI